MKAKILLLLAGIVLLAACNGNRSQYEVLNNADTIAQKDSSGESKLIKTSEMRFKVKNVTTTSEAISNLAVRYHGMIMHRQMNAVVEQSHDLRLKSDSIRRISSLNTSAEIIAKIPSDKLDDFMNRVSNMSLYVNLRKMDIEDRTFEYMASKLKLKSRNELINQQKTGKIVIKNPADVLLLKDDMIDQEIDKQQINDKVKFSLVTLNLYQNNTINAETIANDDPSAYKLPFINRIDFAFANGWYILKELLVAITNLWALILTGVLVWAGIRLYKKRKQNKLLGAA